MQYQVLENAVNLVEYQTAKTRLIVFHFFMKHLENRWGLTRPSDLAQVLSEGRKDYS